MSAMRIHTLDLEFQGRPHTIASFVIEGPSGLVLVETGPGSTLQTLQARLADLGIAPADIRHVLLTHIHLDHAGAAGWWARQGATVYVHPKGAPHLIDPSRLLASATRIYGDRMGPLWGEIVPAPAERVVEVEDGRVLELAGLEIRAWDTPGHANHHLVFQLGETLFTGDAAGIRIPGTPWVDLPAPPPEFDREVWKTTLRKIRELQPTRLFPTHFGPTTAVEEQLAGVEEHLDRSVSIVQRWLDEGLERDAILERYTQWLRDAMAAAGVNDGDADALQMANPKAMSVDGILRYLARRNG